MQYIESKTAIYRDRITKPTCKTKTTITFMSVALTIRDSVDNRENRRKEFRIYESSIALNFSTSPSQFYMISHYTVYFILCRYHALHIYIIHFFLNISIEGYTSANVG